MCRLHEIKQLIAIREAEYRQLKSQDNWQRTLIELIQIELMILHVTRQNIEKGEKKLA